MKMNVVQNSVIAITGLLTSISVLAQHVNGPDLKGTSIPVVADGEIPIESLQKAVTYCYKDAAGKVLNLFFGRPEGVDMQPMARSGETLFLLTIYERLPDSQLAGNGYSKLTVYQDYYQWPYSAASDDYTTRALFLRSTDILKVRPQGDPLEYRYSSIIQVGWSQVDGHDEEVFQVGYGFDRTNTDRNEKFFGALAALGFPELAAKIIDRSEYDELGNIIASKKYVSDVQFVPTSKADLSALPMRNMITNVVLNGITFDALSVVNCVKAKIANP